ncbi:MAG: DUF4381 domain-containing protein [Mariprofundus sp.]|nr:DUF4381 domain-containing protein [Mariprofundus sp.]
MKPDLLAGLRDIHLPEAVSGWPPAIGWWLLLLLLLLSMAAVFWWMKWRKAQRLKPKQFSRREMLKQAQAELQRLEGLISEESVSEELASDESAPAESDTRVLVADLSALLRRVAIQLKPEDASIAGLSGEAWVIWLDSQWDKDAFVCGAGHALLDAPYQRDGQCDSFALTQLAREWIEAQA